MKLFNTVSSPFCYASNAIGKEGRKKTRKRYSALCSHTVAWEIWQERATALALTAKLTWSERKGGGGGECQQRKWGEIWVKNKEGGMGEVMYKVMRRRRTWGSAQISKCWWLWITATSSVLKGVEFIVTFFLRAKYTKYIKLHKGDKFQQGTAAGLMAELTVLMFFEVCGRWPKWLTLLLFRPTLALSEYSLQTVPIVIWKPFTYISPSVPKTLQ